MEYTEQGPTGTLILPSYEESCELEENGMAQVIKGTTAVMESVQSSVGADKGTPPTVQGANESTVERESEGPNGESKGA